MSAARRVLNWIFGIVILLILLAVLFLALFDWNRIKPWLGSQLTTAIGRAVAIKGELEVHWQRNPDETGLAAVVPWPRFTAHDIEIANPDWSARPQFATIQQVQFSLSPLALLGHEIRMPSLKLTGPSVDIERDARGRDNWTFQFAQGGQWTLDVGEVAFDRGTISIDDRKTALHLDIKLDPLGKPIPFDQIFPQGATGGEPAPQTDQSYHFGWTAHGTYRGAAARGSGKIGSVLAVQSASTPFPLQADLRLRDLHIAFAGTLTDPAHLAAFNLRLRMSGQSMSHLYALTGIALPATPPFATDGHLTGQLHRDPSTFRYAHFNGRVGGSDLHGSATYSTAGPRPKLTGTLTSNLLRFADLAPLIGADSNAQKAQRGDGVRQPADKVLPVEPFDTDRWRTMDADVRFSGQRILHSATLPIEDLSTHLVLDDGVLTLDPLRFGVAGGDLDADLHLDGRGNPMRGRLRVSARRLQLKQLFPTVKLMRNSAGDVNADAALSASGNSVAALLGSSSGEAKLLVNGGTISDTLLEEAGLNLANVVVNKLFGDRPVKINCVAGDFTARDGTLTPSLLVFDTEDATVDIDGGVNFADERLDLTLHPHSKGIRLFSLRSPLYVRGTFKNPDVGVQKGPLIARAAGAVALGTVAAPLAALGALIAPSHANENACATLLAQLAQRKPQAPPPGRPH